jgi:hypothetical protein
MKRSIQQAIDDMDKIIDALPDLILKHTQQGALGALALTDLRITETGVDSKGAKFKSYTPAYQKRKTKIGRYRGIVDFQSSGQMLASTTTGFENIKPDQRSIVNGNARISFDGRDRFTRDKLQGNNRTRPGFLQPSATEMKQVNKAANEGLERDITALLG